MKLNPKAIGLAAALVTLSAGSAFAAVANTPVNVRTGPGTQYRVVDTLHRGERVNVVSQRAGWCRVTKSGPDGWVSCRYLSNDHRPRPPMHPRPPRPPHHWGGHHSSGPGVHFGMGYPWGSFGWSYTY